MDPRNYSRLAAVIFAIIALLQLVRVVLAWDIMLNGVAIPLFVSGMACFLAAAMAWLGFGASRKWRVLSRLEDEAANEHRRIRRQARG